MKRKLDESIEAHLTELMFKAISQSGELREYLSIMQEEGALNNKSLLTFCLRPMSLLKGEEESPEDAHETANVQNEWQEVTGYDDFNADEWLKENRLQNPFDN